MPAKMRKKMILGRRQSMIHGLRPEELMMRLEKSPDGTGMVGIIDRIGIREWRKEKARLQKGMVIEVLGSARALIEVNAIGVGKDMMILKISWNTKIGMLTEAI